MAWRVSRRAFALSGAGALAVVAAGAGWGYRWQRGSKPVLAFVAEGVHALDVVGPMEILGRLPDARPIYVGEAKGWTSAAAGPLQIAAAESLDEAPADPHVVVVAGTARRAPSVAEVAWVKRVAARADAVLAVGAGREWLRAAELAPDGQRIFASHGGSGGLDAALEVAASLAGRAYAEGLQLAIEYDPAPPFPSQPVMPIPGDLRPIRAGILVYEGMTALDAIGPYEVLSRLPSVALDLIGLHPGEIHSDTGALHLLPTTSIASAADPEVLVIPGGAYGTLQASKNEALVQWIGEQARHGARITSVCTGALIVGRTGLLAGKTATTHWASRAALTNMGATYVPERFVRHDRLVTAAGVSAGIDVTLALVGDLYGAEIGASVQAQIPYRPAPSLHAGAFAGARAKTIEAAGAVLGRNATASALRMTFLRSRT